MKLQFAVFVFVGLCQTFAGPAPPPSCSEYKSKSTCLIDCRCRWCFSEENQCFDHMDRAPCSNHTSKTNDCKEKAKTGEYVILTIFYLLFLVCTIAIGSVIMISIYQSLCSCEEEYMIWEKIKEVGWRWLSRNEGQPLWPPAEL